MTINCSNEFLRTTDYYKEISGDTPWIVFLCIGSALSLGTLILFIEEIIFLIRNFKGDETRVREIATLLGLYPLVCVMSILALLVPTCTELVDLIISCYLSVCIYTFVHVTIGYFGGDSALIDALSEDKVRLNTTPCCCCCCCVCRPFKLTKGRLRTVKWLSLQVAIVRPSLLFVGAVLWSDGRYAQEITRGSAYIYITTLTAISTLTSMYGKSILYQASRDHLRHHRIVLKFLTFQIPLLLLNLQHLIFNFLATYDVIDCVGARGPKVRARNMNHSALVIEFFLMAVLARIAYRVEVRHCEPQNTSSSSFYAIDQPTSGDTQTAYTNEIVIKDS